jgi:hypothetical protein
MLSLVAKSDIEATSLRISLPSISQSDPMMITCVVS